ncbi:MAG TPA: hypothetical protein EYP10_13515 [Armatimonadetes bacterium]|nr:hypothetical protein [Armatimonadota bacterium]
MCDASFPPRNTWSKYTCIFAVCIALICECNVVALQVKGKNVHIGTAPIAFSVERPTFTGMVAGCKFEGELFLLIGVERKRLTFGRAVSASAITRDRWRYRMELEGMPVQLICDLREFGSWVYATVTLANESSERLLLEIGWEVRAVLDDAKFFGGTKVREKGRKYQHTGLCRPLPLVALFNSSACIAIAYDPNQWLSYFDNNADLTSQRAIVRTSTRIVADARRSVTVSFLLSAFKTRWGHLEALHWYYEAFPRYFMPHPDVDERIWLNGGSYLAWRSQDSV